MKKLLLLLLTILLVGMLYGCGSSESETVEESADPGVVTEEQKTAFLKFEAEVNDLSDRLAELFGIIAEAEGKLTSGEFSNLDMYGLADKAETSASNIWQAYGDVEVSDVYKKEHKELLKKVVDDLEMSAFLHKEAYGSYKKYLDTGSLEEANQFTSDIEGAQSYIMTAVVNITQVKMDLGIE